MAGRAASYREVFAVGEFRALFAAHLLSVVGDQFARVALAVLVFDRTRSPGWTAATYALTFLPAIVAGPLLSGLADRYPRRRVMVAADLARAVLVALMAVPGTPLLAIGALLVAVQLLQAPFNAGRAATLPLMLEGDRFVVASGVINLTYQLALLVGFGTGGVLVAGIGPSGALLIDAVTFVVSAGLVRFGLADRPAAANAPGQDQSWLRRIADGARLVWWDRRLRLLVAFACLAGFYVIVEGLAVPYAHQLGGGADTVGLLLAASPAGAVIGLLLLNKTPPQHRQRLLTPMAVGACLPLIGCVTRPGLAITLGLWLLSGACSAYQMVANAEYVRAVPDAQRGQAFGLAVTALLVAQGIGVLATGALAEVITPATVVAIGGALGTATAAAVGVAWSRLPARKDAPADNQPTS